MMTHKVPLEEHLRHLGSELQRYYDQHGDEDEWSKEEWKCHDLLVNRVNQEDGWTESEDPS